MEKKQTNDGGEDIIWGIWTVSAGILFICIYAFCTPCPCHQWCHIGVLLLMSLAAMSVGCLLGFLFGIPRTLAGSGDSSSKGGKTDYTDNTNLEQISDWLTKILVGVGLTQINSIYVRLRAVAAFAENQLDHAPGSRAVGLAVFIFFFIWGFLRGYLWTRLTLIGRLRGSWLKKEQEQDQSIALNEAISFANEAVNTRSHIKGSDPVRREAIDRLEELRKSFPENRRIGILLGRLYRQEKQLSAAIKVLDELIAERIRNHHNTDVDFADLLYNRACYYTVYSREPHTSEQEKKALLEKARADLIESIRLSASNREEAEKDPDGDLQELEDVWKVKQK